MNDSNLMKNDSKMLQEKRTPELIGAEIRMYVDTGRRISLLCGIEIGRRLVEAKEMLDHGEWLPWLERETEFSSSSAQRYMKLFDEYGGAELPDEFMNLNISQALELIKVPKEKKKEEAKKLAASELSIRELKKELHERYGEKNGQIPKNTISDGKNLKPCPFCGGNGNLMIKGTALEGGIVRGYILVKCAVCGATGKGQYYCGPDNEQINSALDQTIGGRNAVEAWNMRWKA